MECYSSSLPLYMSTNTCQRCCCCCCCLFVIELLIYPSTLYDVVYALRASICVCVCVCLCINVIIHSYRNGGCYNSAHTHTIVCYTHRCLQSFQRPTMLLSVFDEVNDTQHTKKSRIAVSVSFFLIHLCRFSVLLRQNLFVFIVFLSRNLSPAISSVYFHNH